MDITLTWGDGIIIIAICIIVNFIMGYIPRR